MAFPKQAMVLAAGPGNPPGGPRENHPEGPRLGDLGERHAKALVEIDGAPLLAHQLSYLAALGVSRAVVNTSHLAEQVEAFAEGYSGPVDLRVVIENEPLGTAGGVRNALGLF